MLRGGAYFVIALTLAGPRAQEGGREHGQGTCQTTRNSPICLFTAGLLLPSVASLRSQLLYRALPTHCLRYALPRLAGSFATVFECLNDLQIKERRRDCLRNRVYGSSTWQLARHEETITAKYKQTFAVWERCFRTEAANYIPMAEVVCPSRLAQGFTKA